jgi:hypothetical protein
MLVNRSCLLKSYYEEFAMGAGVSAPVKNTTKSGRQPDLSDKEELFLSRQFYQSFENVYLDAKV